eukprot:Platyproteum_vivax@DN8629_c0_g1_i1.p1
MTEVSKYGINVIEFEKHPADHIEYWTKTYNITNLCEFIWCGKASLSVEAENLTLTSNCCCGCCGHKTQNNFSEFAISQCCGGSCNCFQLGPLLVCPGCCGIGFKPMFAEISALVETRKKTHGAHAQVNMLEALVSKVDNMEKDIKSLMGTHQELVRLLSKPVQQQMGQ